MKKVMILQLTAVVLLLIQLMILFTNCNMIIEDYVEYHPGSPLTNIIMTAPHDGHIKPASISHRQKGCYNSSDDTCDWNHDCNHEHDNPRKCIVNNHADRLSSVLALEMRKTITEITGHAPHLIISRLHRSKLDPNRERDDAAQHNAIAEQTYDTFHRFTQEAHNMLSKNGESGIHFDIHGYTTHNTDDWIELGYNLLPSQLNRGDLNAYTSSIRALAERSHKPFADIVAGNYSLGKLVQEEGFRVVPSPQYPRPELGIEGGYLRGGYITRKWGSLNGGNIDCIQMEVPEWVRNDSLFYGKKLGLAFAKWVEEHYS